MPGINALYVSLKGKGSPYSITERRVPELIPVLCSQPAGDVNHKPNGKGMEQNYVTVTLCIGLDLIQLYTACKPRDCH